MVIYKGTSQLNSSLNAEGPFLGDKATIPIPSIPADPNNPRLH